MANQVYLDRSSYRTALPYIDWRLAMFDAGDSKAQTSITHDWMSLRSMRITSTNAFRTGSPDKRALV
jgi:hypothetical protein